MSATIPARPAAPDAAVAQALVLVEALTELIAGENARLAAGLPASAAVATEEKNRLADRLNAWMAEEARAPVLLKVAPALRTRLIERTVAMRDATEENGRRLGRAIAASRRRIDAIMQAVREDIAAGQGYGASGLRTAPGRSGPPLRIQLRA